MPPCEALFVLAVTEALRVRLIGARDLIVDSAPLKAWRRSDPDARYGHAPAHHPTPLLCGYRVHTLLCRGSGLPLLCRLAPANAHDAPFAQPLLALAVHLYDLRPRRVRLDAAYWGAALIAWIHQTLGATAVVPYNPKRTTDRSCLPPTSGRVAYELGNTLKMVETLRLQETENPGGVTHVSLDLSPYSYKDAPKDYVYAEFDVPASSLDGSGQGLSPWRIVTSAKTPKGRLLARRGEAVPDLPAVKNIALRGVKLTGTEIVPIDPDIGLPNRE